MNTISSIIKFISGVTAGLLIAAVVINAQSIKILKQINTNISVNNQQTTTNSEVEVTGDGNTASNTNINSNTAEPEITVKELPNTQAKPEVGYTIYTNYYTLSDETLKELHPYLKDYDLVEIGCPECGYQMYCWDSAGSAATAHLCCTNCAWESKEVHIRHCTDSSEAKKILLDMYKNGKLTKDVEFEYANDYKWY